MSAGVLATTAHAADGTSRELGGLPDRHRGGLQDGRVGAVPGHDQPDPFPLAWVQAGQIGAYRGRAYVADDGDLRRAVQQGAQARGRPGRCGGPDLVRGELGLGLAGQPGVVSDDEAQDVIGADGATVRVGQLAAVAGQPFA